MRDVIHAGAEDERNRDRARGQQSEEVLRGQIRREGPAVRCPVRAVAGQMTDCGTRSQELEHVLAPGIHLHLELHADDAVGAEVIGFGLHPRHRQLPGVVHGLRQDLELLILAPAADLQPDVIDRRPDNEAERLEACLTEEHVLRHRQVRGEYSGGAGAGSLGKAAIGCLRLPRRALIRLVREKRHDRLPRLRHMANGSLLPPWRPVIASARRLPHHDLQLWAQHARFGVHLVGAHVGIGERRRDE